jgi:hypothetical protein
MVPHRTPAFRGCHIRGEPFHRAGGRTRSEWVAVCGAWLGGLCPGHRQGDLQRQVSDPERRQRWPAARTADQRGKSIRPVDRRILQSG